MQLRALSAMNVVILHSQHIVDEVQMKYSLQNIIDTFLRRMEYSFMNFEFFRMLIVAMPIGY
jgi:hypothetical protein